MRYSSALLLYIITQTYSSKEMQEMRKNSNHTGMMLCAHMLITLDSSVSVGGLS